MNEFAAEAHDENELDKVVDHQTEKPVQVFAHKPGRCGSGHRYSTLFSYGTLTGCVATCQRREFKIKSPFVVGLPVSGEPFDPVQGEFLKFLRGVPRPLQRLFDGI